MAYDYKRYVHYHAQNYNEHGITLKNKADPIKALKKSHAEIKSMVRSNKIKKESEKKDAIERRINNLLLSDNAETKNEKNILQERDNFLKQNNAVMDSHGRVTTTGKQLSFDESQQKESLKKHLEQLSKYSVAKNGRRQAKLETIITFCEEAREILNRPEFQKGNLTQSELKKLDNDLSKMEQYIDNIKKVIAELDENEKKSSGSTRFGSVYASVSKNNTMINMLTKKGTDSQLLTVLKRVRALLSDEQIVLTNTQGAILEMVLSDYAQIVATDMIVSEAGKEITKKKGSTVGTQTATADISNRALISVAGLYYDDTGMKSYKNSFLDLKLPMVEFKQISKTDAELTIKGSRGDPARINAKNIGLFSAQTYGINLVKDTSLMTILSKDFSKDMLYHYMNVLADHSQAGDSIDTGMRQIVVDTLSMHIIYRALTGVSGSISDFFVVNNNTYKNDGKGKQYYIYGIYEVMDNFLKLYNDKKLDNETKVFRIYVNDKSDNNFETIKLYNNWEDDKNDRYWFIAYQRRFARMFSSMHSYKLKVAISPKVVDDYFSQGGLKLRDFSSTS